MKQTLLKIIAIAATASTLGTTVNIQAATLFQ
jgi:hypothetical protein